MQLFLVLDLLTRLTNEKVTKNVSSGKAFTRDFTGCWNTMNEVATCRNYEYYECRNMSGVSFSFSQILI